MLAYYLSQWFFNLFAAREPSANVCVAHGTLCNDPSVYPTFSNKSLKQWYWYKNRTVDANFIPGNFGQFQWNHWQPLMEPWLKNTDLSYICTAYFSFQMQVLSQMQNKQ